MERGESKARGIGVFGCQALEASGRSPSAKQRTALATACDQPTLFPMDMAMMAMRDGNGTRLPRGLIFSKEGAGAGGCSFHTSCPVLRYCMGLGPA